MDIQLGDRITYKYINAIDKKKITRLVLDETEAKDYKNMASDTNKESSIEIIKIERQKYEVIEEKKDLLTEEERELLKKLIININQFSCAKVNKISIDKTVHYNIVNFYKNSFYISDIKVKNEFSKLDCNKDYTLSELRIGGISKYGVG